MTQNIVERKIMWGDLDALGIVFYPRYYEWIDGCGHLFFESLGLSLYRMRRDRNMVFGLVETGCRYHRPGRYHQDIRIVTRLDDVGDKTLLLSHRIRDAADKSLLVEGTEKRICMDVSDPDNLRAIPMPGDIHLTLAAALEKGR
jgi:4-hydroxybenzoyl-CoA thioesterase